MQQSNQSSKAEPAESALSKLVGDLPQEFAQLPQDVSHSQTSSCLGKGTIVIAQALCWPSASPSSDTAALTSCLASSPSMCATCRWHELLQALQATLAPRL